MDTPTHSSPYRIKRPLPVVLPEMAGAGHAVSWLAMPTARTPDVISRAQGY